MNVHSLEPLLRPTTIAVIGGSDRGGSVGARVLDNIAEGDFGGAVFAVNPHQVERVGVQWCAKLDELPHAPDLAIVVSPARTVRDVIAGLAAIGGRLAVIVTGGLHAAASAREIADAAERGGVRLLGPNSLGVLLPHARLNASFAPGNVAAGDIALLSQSGAVVTAAIDWAADRRLGFSGILSLGDTLDVGFAEAVELFAEDRHTRALLLYIEHVDEPRAFLSAVRAAAASKPVIALKAGRSAVASSAALTHTGKLAGAWDVHAAALRRAGAVVVETLDDLFDAAAVLPLFRRWTGDRVAVVSNGGGPGVLAVDALAGTDAALATLDAASIATLDRALPADWSRMNPVDIVGDATPDRLRQAVAIVAGDPGVDALLVLHAPTAIMDGHAAATALASAVAERRVSKPVVACWLGTSDAARAAPVLASAGIPLFDSVERASRAIGHLVAHGRARRDADRTPAHTPLAPADKARAAAIITSAQAEGRTTLTACEAKSIVEAFGIAVVKGHFASDADAVAEACAGVHPPYAVKLVSPDLSHKSDVGGVRLDLPDASTAAAAAREIAQRVARTHPEARVFGFDVEPMIESDGAVELLVGIADDPTFGPVIAVGTGGKAVEVLADRALELPPLNADLADAALGRTRVARLLRGYRDVPPADTGAVIAALGAVSRICVDLPDVLELDINPLLAGTAGVIALDARIRIAAEPQAPRLAIRPVPTEWTADLVTRTGVALHVRPVVPSDEPTLAEMYQHVSADDLRFRFFTALREVGRDRLGPMVRVDYDRTITFLAFADDVLVAAAMLSADGDKRRAEVALSVRAECKGRGVGWTLLEHVLRYARAEGIDEVVSIESTGNTAALALERELGFATRADPGDATVVVASKALAA